MSISLLESRPLYLPELAEYRKAAALRHATAFCDAPEYVAGTRVLPLTPRTWSMLFAIGCRFVHGGQIGEGDVRNFLWFHSPLYADAAAVGWQDRKRRALGPFTTMITQPWREWLGLKPDVARYEVGMEMAIKDIRAILAGAFADAETGQGRPGRPIASMEAQLIHAFAAAYRWDPEQTRNTPLRKLFQLFRCIKVANGVENRDTGEEDILSAHMRRRLVELRAAGIEEGKS